MAESDDDIRDGLCCQSCGEFVDGAAPGYPRFCNGCRPRTGEGRSKLFHPRMQPPPESPHLDREQTRALRYVRELHEMY